MYLSCQHFRLFRLIILFFVFNLWIGVHDLVKYGESQLMHTYMRLCVRKCHSERVGLRSGRGSISFGTWTLSKSHLLDLRLSQRHQQRDPRRQSGRPMLMTPSWGQGKSVRQRYLVWTAHNGPHLETFRLVDKSASWYTNLVVIKE